MGGKRWRESGELPGFCGAGGRWETLGYGSGASSWWYHFLGFRTRSKGGRVRSPARNLFYQACAGIQGQISRRPCSDSPGTPRDIWK